MKKYELTKETTVVNDRTLHRIRALTDFRRVKAGDFGGYIEKEENLIQEDLAWVFDDAKVYGDAFVCDNAQVHGNAQVYGYAHVSGNAQVSGDAEVYGDAHISGYGMVHGSARVSGDARVYEHAMVYGKASVRGKANIIRNAKVYGDARISGDALIQGDARVFGEAGVYGNAIVGGYAVVNGTVGVYGEAKLCGTARIRKTEDFIVIGPCGSRKAFTTFYRDENGKIEVKCGCFTGNLDAFLDEVSKTHGDNRHAAVYRAAAETARLQINSREEETNHD